MRVCQRHLRAALNLHAEPFNDDGTWRTDVFYNTLGTSYVSLALQAARAADPAAKLYINDYNIEQTGSKATAMLNLVKSLQSQNVPIDGVGFQCHFIVGSVPTTFQQNLETFTALGLEVAITELDIRMTLPATDALLQQQKKDYQSVVAACQAVEGCIGVTIWDYTDKYSWVPNTFSGQGAACPWDAVRLIVHVQLERTTDSLCRTSSASLLMTVLPSDSVLEAKCDSAAFVFYQQCTFSCSSIWYELFVTRQDSNIYVSLA